MTNEGDLPDVERIRTEAADWLARLRGPDADRLAEGHRRWLALSPAHDQAWRELLVQWDRSKFVANTPTARARDLGKVAVWYRRPGARRLAAAATIIVVASSATVYRSAQNSQPTEILLSTRAGELRTVALADGSTITLDSGSRLSVLISNRLRSVHMVDGLARFAVKPDASRPFAVLTSRGSVTANGGRFDVSAGAGLVRVTSLEGTLTFKPNAPPSIGDRPSVLSLTAGQRATATSAGAVVATGIAKAGDGDWVSGRLIFDGDRLDDAVAALNRHNERKIILADPASAELKITGGFNARDPAGFARVVADLFGLTVQPRSNGAIELAPKKKS